MSTIFQKRDVWYYQWQIDGLRRSKSLKTKDKKAAKTLQKLYDAKLEQRKLGIANKNVTIKEALERHLEIKSATLKSSTAIRYKQLMVALLNEIQQKYCHKLSLEELSDYIKKRKKDGKSQKTIFEELALLKAAIKANCPISTVEELLKNWPTIKKTVSRAERVGNYTSEEVEKLKEYFSKMPFNRFFMFAIYTGCRWSELVNLKWRDIDTKDMVIKVRNIKTESDSANQFRTISIHPELLPVLGKKGAITSFVLPEAKKHSENWARRQMEDACKVLKIQYRRFHGLRHTTATYLLASGVSLRDVMQLMGWTRLDTARRYIHVAEAAAAQINKLPY